jgi:hypothetical protein
MMVVALVLVSSAAFALNIGAGMLRAGCPKFSLPWLLYIHLPILAVIPLRQWLGLTPWTIPLLIAVSVAGQVVGGRFRRNVLKTQGKKP